MSSPLGIRARIGMICRGCELEISRTLLTVDLRIMDMSEFDVILGMDWLTVYRVVIECERRRVTAYTQDDTRVVFQGDKHDILPQTVYESKCQGQLAGCVTSKTRGSVDYPSTRGIQVEVGLPDVTLENRAESPLYGELYPNIILVLNLHLPVPTVQYMQYVSNTATWAHKQYSMYIPTMKPTIYPIVTRVNIFTLKQYIY